jgi:hypothetical protein
MESTEHDEGSYTTGVEDTYHFDVELTPTSDGAWLGCVSWGWPPQCFMHYTAPGTIAATVDRVATVLRDVAATTELGAALARGDDAR